jgi:hypothetical protein
MRGSSVVLTLDPRVPISIFLDPTRVRQIVMNGLTNCSKYGTRGDTVTAIELNAYMAPGPRGELVIEALDRGAGLQGRTLADLSAEFSVRRLPHGPDDVALDRVPGSGHVAEPVSAFDTVRTFHGHLRDVMCVMCGV